MYAVQVCGYHHSGKTTVVTELIKRLKTAGKTVASIKDIHLEGFGLDTPNKNSFLHKTAGANPVIIHATTETDFLYDYPMDLLEIVQKISADWLVIEGFSQFPLPKIICGKTESDLDAFFDRRTIAVSGVISNQKKEYRGLPVFNAQIPEQMSQLFEATVAKVFPLLPYVDEKCCGRCGLTCAQMVEAIIQGEKQYQDCLIHQTQVLLKIGQTDIPIVPFVQKILRNTVLALVSELNGWQPGKKIQITLD